MAAADDRTPAASPAGVQPPYPCCRHCEHENGYDHFFGCLDEDCPGYVPGEDEEPERGGATSAWEHHHG